MTWVWIYVAAWAVTTAITFVAGRHLGDRTRPAVDIFVVCVLAGALWPFLLVGVVELSSVAAYTTAENWLVTPDPDDHVSEVLVTLR
jgi:hypothetical protein